MPDREFWILNLYFFQLQVAFLRDIDWFLIGFATPMEWMVHGNSVDFSTEIHFVRLNTNIPDCWPETQISKLRWGKLTTPSTPYWKPLIFLLGQGVWHVWLSSLLPQSASGNSACPVLLFSMHIFCDHWWASNWHIIRPGWKKSQNVSRLFWSRDVNLSTFVCLKLVFFSVKKGVAGKPLNCQ